MNAPSYDRVCNHCGKEIHPKPAPVGFGKVPVGGISADCVYVERTPSIGMATHPFTNYVCLACNAILDAFLREAGAR